MQEIRKASFEELLSSKKAAFAAALNEVVKPTFTGLIQPESYDVLMDKLVRLNRRAFPRQSRLVAAAATHFRKKDYLIVSSEMGTGKSAMAIATAYAMAQEKGHGLKTVIMCPTHLVQKWAAEVKAVLGGTVPYEIVIVRKWTDLVGYKEAATDKKKMYFFIFSKETAKLGYPKAVSFAVGSELVQVEDHTDFGPRLVSARQKKRVCPSCFQPLNGDQKCQNEVEKYDHATGETKKVVCGCSYRQPEASGRGKVKEALRFFNALENGAAASRPKNDDSNINRRLSVAEYIKRQLPKGWIELLIADEIHELKGGDTGQGNAFGAIASMSKKIMGLTGTLLNGYASSLFYILYRLDPKLMKQTLRLEYTDVKRFVKMFGAVEEIYDAKSVTREGVVTKLGKQVNLKELPKISPHLMTLLLPTTIFLRLDEMNIALPSYEEKVELVEADPEWKEGYLQYISDLAGDCKKEKRLAGQLANDAISLADLPYKEYSYFVNDSSGGYYEPISREDLPMTAKEARALEICKNELAHGRKVLMFVTYTGLGTSAALEKVLADGLGRYKVQALPASVEPAKREKWIKDHPCDVLICNPELVKTGLDLLEFPTIVFFQTTYNVFTLKQAARRSWRIGQEKDVKVYFLVYKDTPQQKALELISKKVAAANSLEGRFSESEDLAALAEDESNLQLAMAKAILSGDSGKASDIQLSTVREYGRREWDAFEQRYIQTCESFDAGVSADVEIKEETISIQKQEEIAPIAAAIVETIIPVEEKVVEVVEQAPVTKEVAGDSKIAVYRRVKQGKAWVEQRLEVTTDEIRAMVADGDAMIQGSLF